MPHACLGCTIIAAASNGWNKITQAIGFDGGSLQKPRLPKICYQEIALNSGTVCQGDPLYLCLVLA